MLENPEPLGNLESLTQTRAFSPNGDGLNDLFQIPELASLDDIDISVFTPAGVLIYQQDKYKNNWDGVANIGQYSGQLLSPGTYIVWLNVQDLGRVSFQLIIMY